MYRLTQYLKTTENFLERGRKYDERNGSIDLCNNYSCGYYVKNPICLYYEWGAIKKGQVEAHAFPIVFFFGIMGCLYVVALPDLVIREQNEDILTALMEIKGRR